MICVPGQVKDRGNPEYENVKEIMKVNSMPEHFEICMTLSYMQKAFLLSARQKNRIFNAC